MRPWLNRASDINIINMSVVRIRQGYSYINADVKYIYLILYKYI